MGENTLNPQEVSSELKEEALEVAPHPHDRNPLIEEEIFLNKKLRNEYARKFLHSYEQNIEERKKYAKWIFVFTCIWSGLMIIVVLLSGFSWLHLTSEVIITLITSTTVNAFGFFYLVVKYLFNNGTDGMPTFNE